MVTWKRAAPVLRRLFGMAALALAAGAPGRVAAQQGQDPVHASSEQSLSFGLVFPGYPEVVRVTDVVRRGVISLEGTGPVDVAMFLPQQLTSAGSHGIPLRFGYGAGGLATTATADPVLFDPAQPQRINLGGKAKTVWLYLGGVADTTHPPPPGSYSATVVVTVSKPNT